MLPCVAVAFSGWATVFIDYLLPKLENLAVFILKRSLPRKRVKEECIRLEEEVEELGESLWNLQALLIKEDHWSQNTDYIWTIQILNAIKEAELVYEVVNIDLQSNESTIDCTASVIERMVEKIKKARLKVEKVLTNIYSPRKSDLDKSWRLDCISLKESSPIFGFSNETNELCQILISDQFIPSVVSLLGPAGMGKTTLARLIYADQRIQTHFGHKIWVSINKNFNLTWLLRTLIEHIEVGTCSLCDAEMLQTKLVRLLNKSRFLIVLDGVWHEKATDWDVFFPILRLGGVIGSSVVVTTQSPVVAANIKSTKIYPMYPLCEFDSELLLKEQARVTRNENFAIGHNMLKLVDDIVRKCEGVPLLLKAYGRLLKLNGTNYFALECASKSNLLDLIKTDDELLVSITNILHYLPAHLKMCIFYCSCFPENHLFEKLELVRMWMAEALIQPPRNTKPMKLGFKYFEELIERSCFQRVMGEKYKVSNIVHTLIKYISAGDSIIIDKDANMDRRDLPAKSEKATSVFVLPGAAVNFVDIFERFNYIRVLNLRGCDLSSLHKSVCKLKLLRHLDASDNPLTDLPKDLGCLSNLRVLSLLDCKSLRSLPSSTQDLVNVFCLLVSRREPFDNDYGIRHLTKLRELTYFVTAVSKMSWLSDFLELEVLSISNLETVTNDDSAKNAKLGDKKFLRNLELVWRSERETETPSTEMVVFNDFGTPPNLEKLVIRYYHGVEFPTWVENHQNLVEIHLEGCSQVGLLRSLTKFHGVKSLKLSRIDDLKTLDRDTFGGAFPCLESLSLLHLSNFEGWSGVKDGDFPCLRTLIISDCAKFTSLPELHCMHALTNVDIMHCCELKHLPTGGPSSSLQRLFILDCGLLAAECRSEACLACLQFKRVRQYIIND